MNKSTIISIPLSAQEQEALKELAVLDDMSEENVMRRALRTYQMIRKGNATLTFPPAPFELKQSEPQSPTYQKARHTLNL